MAASSLMASQTLILSHHNLTTLSLSSPPKHLILLPRAPSLPRPKPSSLSATVYTVFVPASSSSSPTIPNNPTTTSVNPTQSLLTGSTRTITTILALTFSVSTLLASKVSIFALKLKSICTNPSPEELQSIRTLQDSLVCTVGPLFFAALKDRPSGYLNTPLTVVASGMAKWLDIYSGVLMVRVLLSWFPNIPWDRQPLSAIRDLCDPYLNLFRSNIPPIFDTLDVSPLLAFAVLGTLGSILNNSRGTY